MSTLNLTYMAMMLARRSHSGQQRKYTGDPYTIHLAEVAALVQTVAHRQRAVHSDVMIATAWLHDVIEDCDVSVSYLRDVFGRDVALGVLTLSDLEKGNRAERKEASRRRLHCAPDWVQTIKCADLISNTASIVKHDPNFARVYLEEKRLLLGVLTVADTHLWNLANTQLKEGLAALNDAPRTERAPAR